MQDQLIPVVSRPVGSVTVPTVDARKLHAFLEVGKDFSNWIKDQIARARLLENRDFVVFAEKGDNPRGGRPALEYHLTTEAGKHVAMMSQTDKGFEVRDYFIECERVAKSVPALPTDPMAILKLTFEALEQSNRRIEVVEKQIQEFNDNVRLHHWQCYELKLAVTNKVNEFHKMTGVEFKQLYPGVWNKLKVRMQVPSYQAIPAVKFDSALSTVQAFTIHDMPDYVKAQALDLQGGAA